MHDKVFENECDSIITYLSTQDMVSANTIVSLAAKITKKYPVLFLPAFIEDFIRGMPSSKMIQKYDMLSFNNLTSFVNSLKLKSRQYKDSNLGVKDKNLQDLNQREQYQFLSKYASLLCGPLENLLNHNILQALVSYSILKYTYITSENLQDYVMNAYSTTNKEIAILSDKDRLDSFEKYLSDNLRIKINDIISNLHKQEHVIVYDGNVSVTSEYPKFIEHVYDLLKGEKNGTSYATLQRRVSNKFPLFRLAVSNVQIFENILDGLESRNLLVRKKTFWKYSPSNDHLFAMENYNAMMLDMARQRMNSGRTKFFGRKISPELFLAELKSLEYGDLDDEDDQVTRIAGLILSDAVMLQSPRESMEEFDFVIDLKNYNFRSEQEKILKKLDFKITSSVFHCKIMINREATSYVLSKLTAALPAGEQGIIFTCVPVSRDVSEIVTNDKTVQIINEPALRDWCTIMPIIPCRKNSVARIRYGDNVGKIVLVKSLNYESGLATAETIPDSQEILIPIGSIEEMLPNVSSLDDFEAVSESYLSFLRLLADAASGSFVEGLNTKIVAVYDKLTDLRKNTHPELFDKDSGAYFGSSLSYVYNGLSTSGKKYVQLENVYAEIKVSSRLNHSKCTCAHLLNEDNYQTLCHHLVAGLDHLCKESSDAKTILKNTDMLKTALSEFKFTNMKRSIEALNFALGSESQILKSYLKKHINNDL